MEVAGLGFSRSFLADLGVGIIWVMLLAVSKFLEGEEIFFCRMERMAWLSSFSFSG